MSEKDIYHVPVMPAEVVDMLNPASGDIIIDGTVGEGGHSLLLAEKIQTEGMLLAFDRDPDCIQTATKRLSQLYKNFKIFQGSYSTMKERLSEMSIKKVNGVLLDLGFSSRQIFASKRGFSFMKDEILDMRYDVTKGMPAYAWLQSAEAEEIETVLRKYGQESEARRISRAILKHRETSVIKSSAQLREIVKRAKRKYKKRIDPATKTFQAIRIFINDEFSLLRDGLQQALKLLSTGGRLAVLTYHSIEDRIVKDFMLEYSGKCKCPPKMPICSCDAASIVPKVKILKTLRPDEKEIDLNPSSRSAHLRTCEILVENDD